MKFTRLTYLKYRSDFTTSLQWLRNAETGKQNK